MGKYQSNSSRLNKLGIVLLWTMINSMFGVLLFDMINAVYRDKPLIFTEATLWEKLVSHHRAVNAVDSCLDLEFLFAGRLFSVSPP